MNEDLVKLGKSEGEYEFKPTDSVTIEVYDDIKKIIINLNNINGITPRAILSMILGNKEYHEYTIEINANVLN